MQFPLVSIHSSRVTTAYSSSVRSGIALKINEIGDGAARESRRRMARQRRIQEPDLLRHVMARGNARMAIFLDELDYRHFVYLLGRTVEDFSLECWNYCLMPNHYHCTMRPTLPNLSAAIAWLNGSYAQWWNRRYDRVGHVFQGRFKAQIVQREGYPLVLSRYVALNPVRARLVERPEQWLWSSYAATIGVRTAPPFLNVQSTLGLIGDSDGASLRARYADYVLSQAGECEIEHRIRSQEQILGDKPFKLWVRGGLQTSLDDSSETKAA